jgi:hypothetical protein
MSWRSMCTRSISMADNEVATRRAAGAPLLVDEIITGPGVFKCSRFHLTPLFS